MLKKPLKRFTKTAVFCLILAISSLILSFGIKVVWAAWTDPSEGPTGGDIAAPLNVSAASQMKSGKLLIGCGNQCESVSQDYPFAVHANSVNPIAYIDDNGNFWTDGSVTAVDQFIGHGTGLTGTANSLTAGAANVAYDLSCTGCVGNAEVANNAINTAELVDDAVTSAKIADNAVGTSQLQTGAVNSDKILDETVSASDLGTNSVGTDEITENSVGNSEMLDNAIGQTEMRDDAIGVNELDDGECNNNEIFKKDGLVWQCEADAGIGDCEDCNLVFIKRQGHDTGISGKKEMYSLNYDTHFTVSTDRPGQNNDLEDVYYAVLGDNTANGTALHPMYGVYGSANGETSNFSIGIAGVGDLYGAVGCYDPVNPTNCGWLGGQNYAGYFAGDVLVSENLSAKRLSVDKAGQLGSDPEGALYYDGDPANGSTYMTYVEDNSCIEIYVEGVMMYQIGEMGDECSPDCEGLDGYCTNPIATCVAGYHNEPNRYCAHAERTKCCIPDGWTPPWEENQP